MDQAAGAMRAEEMRALAGRLLEIAAEVESAEAPDNDKHRKAPAVRASRKALQLTAMAIYRMRRRRSEHLPPSLLGEVAWDMLLDLFIHSVGGKQINTTSLCHAAEAAVPTGLRWIAILEKHGLVERMQSETDARVTYVNLTDHGMRAMSDYLAAQATMASAPSSFLLSS